MSPGSDRGATLTEYALLLAVFTIVMVVTATMLADLSGTYLSTTGQTVGQPRDRIADIDTDLPDPPDWLP